MLGLRLSPLTKSHVRAVYVEGSWAEASALPSSDLDLMIVLFHHADPMSVAEQVAEAALDLGLEIDVGYMGEDDLAHGIWPNVWEYGRLLVGEDVRPFSHLIDLETWTRDRMHTSVWRIAWLFGRTGVITDPMPPPSQDDSFLGYTARTVFGPDRSPVPSTRDLVRMVSWAATAMVAWKGRQFVTRKRDIPRQYAETVGDAWAAYVEAVFRLCRDEFSYLVPHRSTDRLRLKRLCETTVLFERHFLSEHRGYLVDALTTGGAPRSSALELLERVRYEDDEVQRLLGSAD